MGYVIYRKDTTEIPAPFRDRVYKTLPAARAALTRFNRAWARTRGLLGNEPEAPCFTMGIAEREYYHSHIERSVIRSNLRSGEQYKESVNTPPHLSPAMETYWSQ
jgi:hypothetical protein